MRAEVEQAPRMFPESSPNVPRTFPECSLNVPWIGIGEIVAMERKIKAGFRGSGFGSLGPGLWVWFGSLALGPWVRVSGFDLGLWVGGIVATEGMIKALASKGKVRVKGGISVESLWHLVENL
eukprot:CAMPEP_0198207272 /NCGR_PEP_ID=MMETSP1445-20131203/10746_1 /TAXON_ID=36898 /ORGANISM="Pyramimonas sp., Strain CCMP2087" /LENGTH=122 /DNA_ID=CAMNT_0043880249 /DNA_START=199 /DNA_END=567 /DNA_ORIENTATION=-